MHGSRFRFQVPVPVSLYRCIAVSLFSSSPCLNKLSNQHHDSYWLISDDVTCLGFCWKHSTNGSHSLIIVPIIKGHYTWGAYDRCENEGGLIARGISCSGQV